MHPDSKKEVADDMDPETLRRLRKEDWKAGINEGT